MRHLPDIRENCMTADVHAKTYCEFGSGFLKRRILQYLSKLNPLQRTVRDLDANCRLSGNRLDTYRGCCHLQGNVLRKIRNLAHFHPGSRFQIITRDCRTMTGADNLRIYMETFECLL